jgi:hypothetical protein
LKNLDYQNCENKLNSESGLQYDSFENFNFMLGLVKLGFVEVFHTNLIEFSSHTEKKNNSLDFNTNLNFLVDKIKLEFCRDSMKIMINILMNIKTIFNRLYKGFSEKKVDFNEISSDPEYKEIIENKVLYHNIEKQMKMNIDKDVIQYKSIDSQKKYKNENEKFNAEKEKNPKKQSFNQIFGNKYKNSNFSERDNDFYIDGLIESPIKKNKNEFQRKNITDDDFLFTSDDNMEVKENKNSMKFTFLVNVIHFKIYSGKHFLFDDVIY